MGYYGKIVEPTSKVDNYRLVSFSYYHLSSISGYICNQNSGGMFFFCLCPKVRGHHYHVTLRVSLQGVTTACPSVWMCPLPS